MDFARKKKRGWNQKVRKLWLHPDGYRITWRQEAFGIAVPAAYQACVQTVALNGGEMWDFVERKHSYRSMKTAIAACEKHVKLWTDATQCQGIKKLKAILGNKPTSIPKWVLPKLDEKLLDELSGPQAKELFNGN